MTELDSEVKESLEADGYEVERVGSTTAGPDGIERRTGVHAIHLAVHLLRMAGEEELTRELIHAALARAKGIVRRRRDEGNLQAEATEGVGIWLPDNGGWRLIEYERLDD